MFAYRGATCIPKTHCNTLQHAATRCNIMQPRCIPPHTLTQKTYRGMVSDERRVSATHCNTLQLTVTHRGMASDERQVYNTLQRTATQCNTLHMQRRCCSSPHTCTHLNILVLYICIYIHLRTDLCISTYDATSRSQSMRVVPSHSYVYSHLRVPPHSN